MKVISSFELLPKSNNFHQKIDLNKENFPEVDDKMHFYNNYDVLATPRQVVNNVSELKYEL